MNGRVLREGLLVGLIAYAAVALFYALFDATATRGLLYTVNMLGISVFRGVRDPGIVQLPVPIDAQAVFWYNGLHLVLSLVIGLIVVGLVHHAESVPVHGPAVAFVIVAGFVVTVFVVGALSRPIRPVLPWWSIVLANALAVATAGFYVMRKHRQILRHLRAAA